MSEEQNALDRLTRKRERTRKQVSNTLLDIENILRETHINVTDLEVNLDILRKLEESLEKQNACIEDCLPIADLDKEEGDNLAISAEIISAKTRAIRTIRTMDTISNAAVGSTASLSLRQSTGTVKLPKLSMGTFNGDIENWRGFWSRFEAAVHGNEQINAVEKFNYLKGCLEGLALKSIKGLSLTEENYPKAVTILENRFGQVEEIKTQHMNNLMELTPVTRISDVAGLRRFYDDVEIQVRSLEGLGQGPETYQSILWRLMMKGLPSELRVEFSRVMDSETPTVERILKFLRKEVECRERAFSLAPAAEPPRGNFRDHTRDRQEGISRNFRPRYEKPKGLVTAASLAVYSEKKPECCYCGMFKHLSENCTKVSTVPERRAQLKRKGRCFICTEKQHMARYCPNKKECPRCDRLHHVSVCDQEGGTEEESGRTEKATPGEAIQCSSVLKQDGRPNTIVLQTASAIITPSEIAPNQPTYQVKCFFDGGSSRTYIREDIVQKLKLKPTGQETLTEYKFQDTEGIEKRFDRVKFLLKNVNDLDQRIEIEALVVPDICNASISVPKEETLKELDTKGIKLADLGTKLPNGQEAKVGVLIGSDWFWALATTKVERLSGRLAAIETILGWTIQGLATTVNSNVVVSNQAVSLNVITMEEKISNQIKAFWELDSIGISEQGMNATEKTIEEEIVKKFEETIYFENGRYGVSLPWKNNKEALKDNKSVAIRRTQNLFKKFRSDPVLHHDYSQVIKEQLESGMKEPVVEDPSAGNPVYYLPHREVIRRTSETTRIRVVFDASSKVKGAFSLNDCLYAGKNMNPELLDLLVRFRKPRIAFTADIAKAFLQISLNTNDRDALRFLWRDGSPEDISQPFDEYRITRVAFGVTSSPFLLTATIRHHLDQNQKENHVICEAIREGLYIDDLASGADDVKEAFDLSIGCKEVMSRAGMNLRKWKTNSRELREKWNENMGKSEDFLLTDPRNPDSTILGIKWKPEKDCLAFDMTGLLEFLVEKKCTKRFILQAVARIFDPLGLLAPFTVRGKFLFQELWQRGVDWDDQLDDELVKIFENWCQEVPHLGKIEIPRHYFQERSEGSTIPYKELVCFCDASEKGYAAVVYLRYKTSEGKIGTTLVAAKSRVAPLKKTSSKNKKITTTKITLPKLELTAALLGARLVKYLLEKDFTRENPKLSMWTDSTIALGWIKHSPNKYLPYVSNRVSEIQSLTDPTTWHYCRGVNNPADLPTRGRKAEELLTLKLWWEGPPFLRMEEKDWIKENPSPGIYPKACDEELRPAFKDTYQGACISGKEPEPLLDLEKFSTLKKVLRVMAWVHRFVGNVRARVSKKKEEWKGGPLDAEEINKAERIVIQQEQKRDYGNEISKIKNRQEISKESKLYLLDPFLDENGLLSVGGRLEKSEFTYREKHPWILDPTNQLSRLVADSCHLKTMHGGQGMTMTHLRERFWIPRARQLIKSRINSCLICRRLSAKPGKQIEAPLPADRIRKAKPFEITGVDFAGPLHTKTGKTTTEKSYIALFTCAVTRATHLELVPSLTTERFLQAFRQFAARRGIPSTIYSDNALTFKKASEDLKIIWKTIRDRDVMNYFSEARITWKFIVERGAWWGGWYERMVGLTKIALRKVLGKAKLDKEEMRTLLAEVEAILNSRPLTFTYNEKDEPSPLTPGHFLIGDRLTSLPSRKFPTSVVVPSTKKELTNRLKYQQALLERIWQRWNKEYLLELRTSNERKPASKGTEYQIDDLVMVQEDRTPRMLWKTGLIAELFKGRDGITRSCRVRLPNGTFLKRPIQLLYKLEVLN